MVSDQEPRYRLVDSDGNIVGSLYGKADGSIAIQETDSGSDREVTLAPDGTFSAPSVETESLSTDELNNKPATITTDDSGEFRLVGFQEIAGGSISTTSGTYEVVLDSRDGTPMIPKAELFKNTNIDNTMYASVSFFDRGDNGTVRLLDSPGTELSGVGSFDRRTGPIAEYQRDTGDSAEDIQIEMKSDTDGEQFEIRALTVNIWEEIA